MHLGWFSDIADYLADIGRSETREASGSNSEDVATSFAAKRMALYIAVSYVANALSMCEIKTYRDGKSVKDELYYALNVSPNPNQSAAQLMNKLIESYFYEGHALLVQPSRAKNAYYVADGFGFELHPLQEDEFVGVSVEKQSLDRRFKASEVCYFRLENTELKSIVHSMYREFGQLLTMAVDSFKQANGEKFIFEQSHSARGTRGDEKSSADEVNDRLKSFIRSPNGVLPLHQGQAITRLASNGSGSSDDVISLRKDIFEMTAQALKIPQSMMYGNMTNTNDVINQFITFGVDPIACALSQELTRKFFTYEQWAIGGCRVSIDTTKIYHTDMFQVADKAEKLVSSGIFSVDDVREPLGADRIGEDWSTAHWITKNYSLIQDALQQMMQGTAEGGEERA